MTNLAVVSAFRVDEDGLGIFAGAGRTIVLRLLCRWLGGTRRISLCIGI